jgi:hypothetical protein
MVQMKLMAPNIDAAPAGKAEDDKSTAPLSELFTLEVGKQSNLVPTPASQRTDY